MFGFSRGKTYVVDFATLADGRIAGLLTAGLLTGRLFVPDLEQYEAANSALVERAKTTLAQLKQDKNLKVQSVKSSLEGEELFKFARQYKARIIAASDKLSEVSGVLVTRLNAIHDATKPVYLPGAEIKVKIVKRGKEPDEGIGYLEGGITVVVDDGSGLVGKEVEVLILGALDTNVGRVVFARPKYTEIG